MPRLAIPLSDLKCRTAKPRDRAYKLFDGGGMYLYVTPSGSKTWRLRYFKPNGKEGTLIIGKYPIVSLAVARSKRDEAKALLLDNLDPMEEKQKAKIAAQRASLLFETVALEWHVEMSRRWTEGHAKTVLSRLRTHVFPLIGQRPIVELDTHDLLEVTQRIRIAAPWMSPCECRTIYQRSCEVRSGRGRLLKIRRSIWPARSKRRAPCTVLLSR